MKWVRILGVFLFGFWAFSCSENEGLSTTDGDTTAITGGAHVISGISGAVAWELNALLWEGRTQANWSLYDGIVMKLNAGPGVMLIKAQDTLRGSYDVLPDGVVRLNVSGNFEGLQGNLFDSSSAAGDLSDDDPNPTSGEGWWVRMNEAGTTMICTSVDGRQKAFFSRQD